VYDNNNHAKSPDGSYVPKFITMPPALPNPNTISPQNLLGNAYPTVVFECGFTNENWAQLLGDARIKTFSAITSIQIWIGCKLYRSNRTYRCVWGRRRAVGHNMRIERMSPRMSIDVATARTFRLPANLIYWGAPVPAHIMADFVLPLDGIREAVLPAWF
jgi:hypothetical protein